MFHHWYGWVAAAFVVASVVCVVLGYGARRQKSKNNSYATNAPRRLALLRGNRQDDVTQA